ncbi:MAG: D-tyrosyl-tRNA(Tyr) deacylase [Planctomicrobium sp.]|jgi:D-aminoacyl-tRNA deacylase|nr:D-tyrosyl-tRNA(Tyr) deacylase [Planctomicrobium sp.]
MRAVVQRVSSASVTVDEQIVGQIEKGFVVLLGITGSDTEADVNFLANKIIGLRVFEDADEKMNCSIVDVGGSLLVISQFTLFGDCRKGRRPSFNEAARPEKAKPLYESFVSELRAQGVPTETGTFQAHMDVALVNDGPVTLLLDSQKLF